MVKSIPIYTFKVQCSEKVHNIHLMSNGRLNFFDHLSETEDSFNQFELCHELEKLADPNDKGCASFLANWRKGLILFDSYDGKLPEFINESMLSIRRTSGRFRASPCPYDEESDYSKAEHRYTNSVTFIQKVILSGALRTKPDYLDPATHYNINIPAFDHYAFMVGKLPVLFTFHHWWTNVYRKFGIPGCVLAHDRLTLGTKLMKRRGLTEHYWFFCTNFLDPSYLYRDQLTRSAQEFERNSHPSVFQVIARRYPKSCGDKFREIISIGHLCKLSELVHK